MAKTATKKKPTQKAKPSAAAGKAKKTKYTYLFGKKTDGDASMRALLGGKGANLAEMARIGLPVPPGFTITTEVCTYYYDNNRKYPKELEKLVKEGVASVEAQMGNKFGDEKNPLLFSVRSGARESMPGMMDTILNLGLNDKTVEGLAQKTNNPRFAYDCYRRFIQMYGDVVMGVVALSESDPEPFHEVMETLKAEIGKTLDKDFRLQAGLLHRIGDNGHNTLLVPGTARPSCCWQHSPRNRQESPVLSESPEPKRMPATSGFARLNHCVKRRNRLRR